jgi:hypothetical protein
MPDPIRLLRTLRQAVQAFRETPGRRGRLVVLSGAADTLVAGDLHGNVENFRQLLGRADLGQNPRRQLVLQEVIHGPFDYPTGGDKSHQLLDLIAALKCQYPHQVHFLLGNHELSQWTRRRIGKSDYDLNEQFRQGVGTAYGPHASEVYAAYLDLFAAASFAVRSPNRVLLTHSLPAKTYVETFNPACLESEEFKEADLTPGGSLHALVWGRDLSATTAAAFLAKMDADWLITGHIPCDNGFYLPNPQQIILDALGTPTGYCLFPADRALTHEELVECIATL